MNILGIIAEYNPFHNGHLYQLEMAKKIIQPEATVAIISGNFVQRGEPSLVDKWTKAKMALENGVDLVIELPTIYALSSAENFADGSIKILNSLGIISHIAFGVEDYVPEAFDKISTILSAESPEYKKILKEELKKGLSFPVARSNSILKILNSDLNISNSNLRIANSNSINSPTNSTITSPLNFTMVQKEFDNLDKEVLNRTAKCQEIQDILKKPNNTLAIEYLKALKKQKSPIIAVPIKRKNNAQYDSKNSTQNNAKYNNTITMGSTQIKNEPQYLSASEIRKMFQNMSSKEKLLEFKQLQSYVPQNVFEFLEKKFIQGQTIESLLKYEKEIMYEIKKMSTEQLKQIAYVSEGLENSLKKAINQTNSLKELIEIIKSKRYTQTRLQRILVSILLGITKEDLKNSKEITPYIRVLGFNEKGRKLISKIKTQSHSLNIITSVKKFKDELDKSIKEKNVKKNSIKENSIIESKKIIKRLLDLDILATNIYTLGYSSDYCKNYKNFNNSMDLNNCTLKNLDLNNLEPNLDLNNLDFKHKIVFLAKP